MWMCPTYSTLKIANVATSFAKNVSMGQQPTMVRTMGLFKKTTSCMRTTEDTEEYWRRKIVDRLPQRWHDDPEVLDYYKHIEPWTYHEYHGSCPPQGPDCSNMKNFSYYCEWRKTCAKGDTGRRFYSTSGKPATPQTPTKPPPDGKTKKKDAIPIKTKDVKQGQRGSILGPFMAFLKKFMEPAKATEVAEKLKTAPKVVAKDPKTAAENPGKEKQGEGHVSFAKVKGGAGQGAKKDKSKVSPKMCDAPRPGGKDPCQPSKGRRPPQTSLPKEEKKADKSKDPEHSTVVCSATKTKEEVKCAPKTAVFCAATAKVKQNAQVVDSCADNKEDYLEFVTKPKCRSKPAKPCATSDRNKCGLQTNTKFKKSEKDTSDTCSQSDGDDRSGKVFDPKCCKSCSPSADKVFGMSDEGWKPNKGMKCSTGNNTSGEKGGKSGGSGGGMRCPPANRRNISHTCADKEQVCGNQTLGSWYDNCVAYTMQRQVHQIQERREEDTMADWLQQHVVLATADEDEPATIKVKKAPQTERQVLEEKAEVDVLQGMQDVITTDTSYTEEVDEYYCECHPQYVYFLFHPYSFYDLNGHLGKQRANTPATPPRMQKKIDEAKEAEEAQANEDQEEQEK